MKQPSAVLVLLLTLASCASPTPMPVAIAPTLAPTYTSQPTDTPVPTQTPSSTPTPVLPTATTTATPSATATATRTATATQTRVPTAKPTLVLTRAPLAPPTAPPPSGMVFPAPKLVQPLDGIHRKTKPFGVGSSYNNITFEWLPVGTLENGKIRCSFKDQRDGTEAAIFDRYIVKLDPPLPVFWPSWDKTPPTDSFTDMGTSITVELGRFRPDTTYTWKVAVGRWCIVTLGVPVESFVGLLSPFSESRTFRYSPP